MYGPHFQNTIPDWPKAVAKLPAGTPVKSVDDYQLLREAKRANPGVFTVYRKHAEDMYYNNFFFDNREEVANAYFDRFIDGTWWQQEIWRYVDAIEEFNEYWAVSHTPEETATRVLWAEAVAKVWWQRRQADERLRHIRLVIGNAAIGNDMPVEIARIATQYDCIVGYHPYVLTEGGEQPDWEWPVLSGRWDVMDMEYQAAGYSVDWYFSEGGPFYDALAGWREARCCAGDIGLYTDALDYWIQNAATTPAYHEGRILGTVLFTVSNDSTWRWYDLDTADLMHLADYMAAYQFPPKQPTPPPPPPPEPEPEPEVNYVVTVNLLRQEESLHNAALVLADAYDKRESVVFSADDAARLVAPGLMGSMVKVWGEWPGIGPWLHDRGVGIVEYRQFPQPEPPPTSEFDFPVGTIAERSAAVDDWPGEWIDANPYGSKYSLGYHTGADLNLNKPTWDLDRGKPVYAVADGVVTYAGRYNDAWGIIIVIRHPPKEGGNVYSRYSAVDLVDVMAGQIVSMGDQIAVVGRHYEGQPYHLHFDISPTERLADDPGDWPGLTWSRIERDYVAPLPFILARKA